MNCFRVRHRDFRRDLRSGKLIDDFQIEVGRLRFVRQEVRPFALDHDLLSGKSVCQNGVSVGYIDAAFSILNCRAAFFDFVIQNVIVFGIVDWNFDHVYAWVCVTFLQ